MWLWQYILPCIQGWTNQLQDAQHHSGVPKWVFSPDFRPSILSLHVIPLFSLCFTSRGQEAGAATLHHWDHGMVVLAPFTPPSSVSGIYWRPEPGLTSSRTHHWLWPWLRLERSVGVAPHLRGDQRAAACMDSLALVTLHHHTAGWHQDGCLQMGTSICCQILRWGNISIAPHLEAAAFCQKASTAFYFTSESRLGKKCWFGSLQLKPNSEVFSQTENRIQKHFVTSKKRR